MKKYYNNLYSTCLGIFTVFMLSLNTLLTFVPVLFFGFIKIIPNMKVRNKCNQILSALCGYWIKFNEVFIQYSCNIRWDIKTEANFDINQWYLVMSNHQSWLDIVVLQKLLHNKIPELKFFVKDQLKWVPILGFTWWIFNHPFMKRFSKEYLEKNPHKKGQDLLATKKSCEKFKHMPVAIMNFIEGTRFTKQKHLQQKSPYKHLLKAKAGGAAYVLNSLGDKITSIIDVTITYPNKQSSLWDYVCGRVNTIRIYAREIKIPEQFTKMNYFEDPDVKLKFQTWLNEKWAEKDKLCEAHRAIELSGSI